MGMKRISTASGDEAGSIRCDGPWIRASDQLSSL